MTELVGPTFEDIVAGVVSLSSGNHAQADRAVCAAARHPRDDRHAARRPRAQDDATRGYGAEIVLYDRYTEHREGMGVSSPRSADSRSSRPSTTRTSSPVKAPPPWNCSKRWGPSMLSGSAIVARHMTSVSVGLMIVREVLEDTASIATVSQIARWATVLLWLIWTLRIRNRLNEYSEASVQSTVRVSALWSWLFQMFYLQFKINEALDSVGTDKSSALVCS